MPDETLTRRQWLSRAPLALTAIPALAAEAHAATTTHTANNYGAQTYNIRDHGAVGDGRKLDTAALQTAIDLCSQNGGGTVLVPAGTFLIGTTELKSNVTLHIAAAGKLLGSADGKQYHAVPAVPLSGDTTLEDGNWALLFAVNATNITLEGPGAIDGQGLQFHAAVRGQTPPSGLGGAKRPYHLLLYHCENVTLRHLDLLDGAYHSLRIVQSRRLHFHSLYIHNRVNGNNDGFHFISAEHVTISNCIIKSQDDACAMFGSCRNITITNSYFSTRWSVFRFGGGHAENITVSNCILQEVYGCPIKFQGDPGSIFQNMSFSNLVLDNVTGPISISIGGRLPAPQENIPVIARNISFSNIHGNVTTNPQPLSESAIVFNSSEYPGERHSCIVLNSVNNSVLENISFENIHLTFGGGGTAEDAARRNLPFTYGEYFRLGPMPAFGLYARNVRGITLNNVRFQVATPDLRPAIVLDHAEDVAINALSVQGNPQAESALRFTAAKQVLLTATRLLSTAAAYLQLEGTENSGIILDGGDQTQATTPVTYLTGATKEAIKLRP